MPGEPRRVSLQSVQPGKLLKPTFAEWFRGVEVSLLPQVRFSLAVRALRRACIPLAWADKESDSVSFQFGGAATGGP